MKELAPIAVSTYSRVNHLRQAIEALQKNTLAKESDLYVFSDAPKAGDEDKVAAVRRYLHGIQGFKNITIFERQENDRVRNNRGGMAEVLDIYGRIIFLEEDVVTSPGFLGYMNEALTRYESEPKVLGITGWSPPFRKLPPLPDHSAFFIHGFPAWGFGIWKDRFERIKAIDQSDLLALKSDKKRLHAAEQYLGKSVLRMFELEASGRINALDVRCCFHQIMTGEVTLAPYPSLTNNIGLDGTGEHCGVMHGLGNQTSCEVMPSLWPSDVALHAEMASLWMKRVEPSIYSRLVSRLLRGLVRLKSA